LPAHIAQRICNRAVNLLAQHNLANDIQPKRVRSTSPGAGIFLSARYESISAGVGVLGKKGKPSEQVAQEAVELLLAFHNSNAVMDRFLADQLVLPLALLQQPVQLSVERISQHTRTNLWVIEQFLGPFAELADDPPRIQLWT
jgi:RNA 3'-terminal phosphate cyclase (ATP)